jgi:hypothetical protein
MPVRFAVAAFRFGHSLVRNRYKVNEASQPLPLFSRDPNEPSLGSGFQPVPSELRVDWRLFFEIDGSTPQKSRRFDPKLAHVLFDLPFIPKNEQKPETSSLAFRNLNRGRVFGLPSGEAVAKTMRIAKDKILTAEQLGLGHLPAGHEKFERSPLSF